MYNLTEIYFVCNVIQEVIFLCFQTGSHFMNNQSFSHLFKISPLLHNKFLYAHILCALH